MPNVIGGVMTPPYALVNFVLLYHIFISISRQLWLVRCIPRIDFSKGMC